MSLKQNISTIISTIVLISIPISNGLCTSNCSACALEYSPPFTVVYNASKARPDLRGQTFTIQSSDSSVISNSVSKYFIIQGGILRINNATNFSRNDIALNVFGNTILPVTYHFTVFAAFPTVYSILVCVQGQDNNTPTFPRSEVLIPVLEGTILSWPMDLAADNDEGENSTQNYSILSNDPSVNSDLYLDIARNRDNKITSILLISTVPLDPGRKASYNFTMVAQEGRPNTTKGYQKVYVIVQYLCNSVPIFEMSTYQISLPLSTAINVNVVMIKALHISSQNTAPIYYSIASACAIGQSIRCSSSSASTNFGPFALDSRSGNLTLTSALDYNQAHQFNITLVATDACNLVGSALVLVQITLIPPSIQVIVSNNGMFREDYSLTSDVATVIVSDPDHLNVSVIVLDNATGLMSDTFYLVGLGSSYRLRLLHTLDSKVKSSYYITIQASDPANNVVYFTFNVTIVGINHPPIFANKTVFINIPYNTGSGMRVLHVHASDNDVGSNGVVIYELPPPNATFLYQNNFTVINVTGDILVNGTLDRNVAKSFLLLIKARDNPTNGDPSLSDYMVVNVTLVDAQLYFAFLDVSFTFQVQEGEPAGTIVGAISTSLSYTGQVSFTILHSTPDDAFAMDSANGTITTKRALSAATGGYTLLIAATYYPSDQSTPPTSIQQVVTITVTQQNQKEPISSGISLSTAIVAAVVASSVALAVTSMLVAIFFASCALRQKRKGRLAITEPDSAQAQTKEAPCEEIKMAAQVNESIVASPEQVHPCDSIYADSHQTNSPSCQSPSPNKDKNQSAIRSTSDLASTVTTEMLTDMEYKDPFISEQVAAIYVANAQLLQEGHSQDSVHMFGSEGGFEVDEVDFGPSYFDDDDNDDSGDSTQNHSQRSAGQSTTELKGVPVILYPNGAGCINPLQHPTSHGSQPVLAQQQRWPYPHLDLSRTPRGHHGHSYSCDAHEYNPHKARYTSLLTVDRLQSNIQTSTPLHNLKDVRNRGCMSFSQERFSRDQVPKLGISNCMNDFQVLPSHLTDSHNDIHSATPPSASPTDDGIITAQRDPVRYLSNLSLGSTHLS